MPEKNYKKGRRPIYWPQSVQNEVSRLRKGDRITVLWIDASESSNVSSRGPLHNHNVESVCSSEGSFLKMQRGTSYSDIHLVMIKDTMDRNLMVVQSLPLALVKSITLFHAAKSQLISLHRKRRTSIHFKDGTVKQIGAL